MPASVPPNAQYGDDTAGFLMPVTPTDLVRVYGFSNLDGWSCENGTATFVSDGEHFTCRCLPMSRSDAVRYRLDFVGHLRSVGLPVEDIVAAVDGNFAPCVHDDLVVLTRATDVSPLGVLVSDEQAQQWGELAARMHIAARDWRPATSSPSAVARRTITASLEQALAATSASPVHSVILARETREIIGGCEAVVRGETSEPAHGDFRPRNLLLNETGLRAVGFDACGDAPAGTDAATALRSMPWRENRDLAARCWRAWLGGYRAVDRDIDALLPSMPALACWQHLHWMLEDIAVANEMAEIEKIIAARVAEIDTLMRL